MVPKVAVMAMFVSLAAVNKITTNTHLSFYSSRVQKVNAGLAGRKSRY